MAAADGPLGPLFELAEADGLGIKVGVLAGAMHTDEKGRSVPVAEYAMANEYGTRRIPPRAAFRSTADARISEWEDLLATRLWDGLDPRDALAQTGGLVEIELASKPLQGVTHFTPCKDGPHEIAVRVDKQRFFDSLFRVFEQ